jgi:tetratricopeptide (TPR) repeat protein
MAEQQLTLEQALQLALKHHEASELPQAQNIYQQVLKADPKNTTALHYMGIIASQLDCNDMAINFISKAIEITPTYAEALNSLGNVMRDMGRKEEACEYLRKAIATKPLYAEAHRHLALMCKHTEVTEEVKAMERGLLTPNLSDGQKMHFSFGLGKVYENLRQYEKAFEYIAQGNALKRASYNYNPDTQSKQFQNLKSVFAKEFFEKHAHSGHQEDGPIFILGMPRSGTTLIEQILASHPKVFGAGEIDSLFKVASVFFQKFEQILAAPDEIFTKAGEAYAKAIRQYDKDHRYITNKTPQNFLHIGLIKLFLPKAKIIHCRRKAEDTCLSIFKHYFSSPKTHEYAYDLKELGQYYIIYTDLMDHWHSTLPGFILDVQYEDLVSDQETQTRRLLEFCGLEWHPDCLNFHKSSRSVKTASSNQVRKKIYDDAIEYWKNFEDHLGPLLEELRKGS